MVDEHARPGNVADARAEEIAALKRQMEEMQQRLAQLAEEAHGDDSDAVLELCEDAPVPESDEAAAGEAGADAAQDDIEDESAEVAEADEADSSEETAPESADADDVALDDVADSSGGEVEQDGLCAEDASIDVEPVNVGEPARTDAGSVAQEPEKASEAAFRAEDAVVLEPVAASASSFAGDASFAPPAEGSAPVQSYAPPRPQEQVQPQPPEPPQAQGFDAYTPPANAGYSQPAPGAPTPPPAYDAAAAYAAQQAAQAAYAQPTGQQAYAQPTGQQAYRAYQAPYGAGYSTQPQQPYMGAHHQPVVRTKDHVAAGLLGIFLGMFGIHKFYLGYNTAGFIMLGVSILAGLLTLGLASSVVWLIGLVEGIIYLVKNQPEFERIYVFNKREWF